jgi:hypothetical protein
LKGASATMPNTTFDMIEPNVAESDVNGGKLVVTWKCPVTGKIVGKSEAQMSADASTGRAMSAAAQRSLVDAAIQGLLAFISSTFGGLAGKVAVSASAPARGGALQHIGRPVYGKASQNAAALVAFEAVKDKFRWDENRELFVAAS